MGRRDILSRRQAIVYLLIRLIKLTERERGKTQIMPLTDTGPDSEDFTSIIIRAIEAIQGSKLLLRRQDSRKTARDSE